MVCAATLSMTFIGHGEMGRLVHWSLAGGCFVARQPKNV